MRLQEFDLDLAASREIANSAPEPAAPPHDQTAVQASAMLRLRNYTALVDRAADVFGDEITASLWLSTPSRDFKGRTPVQAALEVDYDPAQIAALFEPVFIVIEHGIYT